MASLVFVGVAAVVPAMSNAAFAGKNGRIAFGMAEEVYQGSEEESYLVYALGVGVVRPDGRGRRTITADGYPAFSPRGRFLALAGQRKGGIVIRRPDGTKVARVTRGRDVFPTWAPSGRRLAFSRLVREPDYPFGCEWTGTEEVDYGVYSVPCPAQLYTVGRDGQGLRLLAERGWNPSWSSLGEIAYVGPDHGIWVSDSRGGGARKVVPLGSDPDWSPDGERIVFVRGGVFVIHKDGSGLRRIYPSSSGLQSPAWSPNGRKIAFVKSGEGRGTGLYTISLAKNARPSRVTEGSCPPCGGPGTFYGVSWQPLRP